MSKLLTAMTKMAISAAILGALWVITWGAETRAQDGLWSSPIPLSPTNGSASYPRMAADQSGRLHVIWSQKEDLDSSPIPGRSIYYTSLDPVTDKWAEPNSVLVAPDGTSTHRPALLYDGRGRLHVSWSSGILHYAQAGASPPPISAVAWTAPRAVSQNVWDDRISELAVDSKGVLHLVWEAALRAAGSGNLGYLGYNISYSRSLDSGERWETQKTISLPDENPYLPRIYVDSQDRIFVIWWSFDQPFVEGGSGRYVIARSTDGGESFQEQTIARGSMGIAAVNNMALAEAHGELTFVWTEQGRLQVTTSTDEGRSWSDSRVLLTDVRIQGLVDLAADPAGHVHAFTEIYSLEEKTQIVHLVSDGDNWHTKERLYLADSQSPSEMGEIRAIISQGNRLNLIYSLADVQSRPLVRLQVWYTYCLLDAPALSPSPVPTLAGPARSLSAPILQPTWTPVPAATYSPLPTVTEVATRTWKEETPIRDETMSAIGLPVLTVVGLLTVVVLVRAWRRD